MTSTQTKVIAMLNQKGGVGKTTIAYHLIHYALREERTVLAIDLDPQGNLTLALTGDFALLNQQGGSASLFPDPSSPTPSPSPLAAMTAITPRLQLLHGHQHLDAVEQSLALPNIRATAAVVRSLPFDVIFVDTAPSVSSRQLAPLFWADLVVVPMEADEFSVSGLAALLKSIRLAKRENSGLVYRAAINRFKIRSKYQNLIVQQLEEQLAADSPSLLLRPLLSERVPVAEAIGRRKPVWAYGRSPRPVRAEWLAFCEAVYGDL